LSAPTYLHRLRLEGAVLAACGAIGTVGLLAATSQSRNGPLSTAWQLVLVALLLLWLGPRGVRHSIADSTLEPEDQIGSGEPTPLWHIVLIVVVLAAIAGTIAGWDAGIRVTGGCLLVGAVQALLLAHMVDAEQRRTGRTFYRIAGSRILKGTRLGYVTRADRPVSLSTPP
jgi:hypothetical protein